METASDSARSLLESMPTRSAMSDNEAIVELEKIRANVYFAAFEKFECVILMAQRKVCYGGAFLFFLTLL